MFTCIVKSLAHEPGQVSVEYKREPLVPTLAQHQVSCEHTRQNAKRPES